jgi:hypothetical protein
VVDDDYHVNPVLMFQPASASCAVVTSVGWSASTAPTRRIIDARFGKFSTTSVRRFQQTVCDEPERSLIQPGIAPHSISLNRARRS